MVFDHFRDTRDVLPFTPMVGVLSINHNFVIDSHISYIFQQ